MILKSKKLITIGILLIVVLICVLNCQKDDSQLIEAPVTEQNSEYEFKLENLTYSQVKEEATFLSLYTKFKIDKPRYNTKTNKYYSKVNNLYSKSVASKDFSDLDPSIDMSVVKKITSSNYVSYTMKLDIPENTSNSFYNVVIQESNNVQEIFTLKYSPNLQQEESSVATSTFNGTYTMSRGLYLPDENGDDGGTGEISGGAGENFVEVCYEVMVIVDVPCTGAPRHINGETCQCGITADCQRATYDLQVQDECYWDYIGSDGSSGTDTGSGDNDVGNGGGSTDGPVVTMPIKEILPEGALEVLIECLQPNQQKIEWINSQLANNSTIIVNIWGYISINGCNQEHSLFLNAAVEALMQGNEVDFVNELIFSNAFKQTKAYCVIKLLTETNNNLFQDVISQFTSNNSKKMLRFMYEPLTLTNGSNDTTTEANTSPPDPLGITTIRFNSNTNSANNNSLEIAGIILHEAIHAELFRIVEGENNVPEPLPQDLYDMMVYFLEFFENNGSPQFITSNAQHTFMANNYVEAIANAVRIFDNNTHALDNYMSFGWEGLSQIGISTQPTPLVTMEEINNYYHLAQVPLTDNHNLSCDE